MNHLQFPPNQSRTTVPLRSTVIPTCRDNLQYNLLQVSDHQTRICHLLMKRCQQDRLQAILLLLVMEEQEAGQERDRYPRRLHNQ